MIYRISVLTMAVFAGFLNAPIAMADTIDRSTHERVTTPKPLGLTKFFGNEPTGANEIPAQQTPAIVGDKSINIAQPTTPEVQLPPQTEPVQLVEPEPVQQANPAPVKKAASKPSKKATQISEAKWWETEGNPKVFAFRDCISGYARGQAQEVPELNLQSVVAKAIKTECEPSFSMMSQVIAARFGQKKSRTMAKELTGSTFVPAVREAVLKVREEQRIAATTVVETQPAAARAVSPTASTAGKQVAELAPAQAAPAASVSGEVELELAKEEMFSCYRDVTDREGPRADIEVEAAVDQVLLDCSDNTRAFFKRLFALYPHSPEEQSERMRVAIATNYRPAIQKRVLALRTAGVSIQKQKVTSTGQ